MFPLVLILFISEYISMFHSRSFIEFSTLLWIPSSTVNIYIYIYNVPVQVSRLESQVGLWGQLLHRRVHAYTLHVPLSQYYGDTNTLSSPVLPGPSIFTNPQLTLGL